MKVSKSFIPTLKEVPQEAERKSHILMLRAGFIRKLASGTYSYLPLGLRVLRKIEEIIREEMNRAGALEVLLPMLHPAEIWRESGRWEILGDDMIHFKDRHGKENVLAPTHEEVVTDLVKKDIQSYKQLPLTLYQIQTKFRDEMRPRSGIIRSREFIMKDAYSFHEDAKSLDETYELMKKAYERIFKRCGLEAHLVKADPGAMGGSDSQEFVLISDAGEDRVVLYGKTGDVESIEMARRRLKNIPIPASQSSGGYREVHTPKMSSIESVCRFLKKKPVELVKTMIYEVPGSPAKHGASLAAVLIRGDHDVSDYKMRQILPGAKMASRDAIDRAGSSFGFSGPVGLSLPLYVDEDVLLMRDFVVGANKRDFHLVDVNLSEFVKQAAKLTVGDYRQVIPGDVGPDGSDLDIKTAIELGHIFKLNTRYTDPLKARILDLKHESKSILMGCYGIGVNRIAASAIEQGSKDNEIIWPSIHISPYKVLVLPLNMKDDRTAEVAFEIYRELDRVMGDVLIDDRDQSAGVKFNDADLLGIPIQVVVGPKSLKNQKIEIRIKSLSKSYLLDVGSAISDVRKHLDTMI